MPMASASKACQSAKRGLPFVKLRASTLELCGFHRFRRFLTASQDRKTVGALIHRVIRESGRPENGEKRSINGEKTAFATLYDDGHTLRSQGCRAPPLAANRYAYCSLIYSNRLSESNSNAYTFTVSC